LVVGGVILIVVTGGASSVAVTLGASLLIGTGVTGMQNAVQGIIQKNF
jgi:hypothetical protein